MEEQKIKDHIIDYLMNHSSEAITDQVLIDWLNEKEANQINFNQYKKIWNESANYIDTNIFDSKNAWERVHLENKRKENRNRRLKNIYYSTSGIAASILLIVFFSLNGFFNNVPDTRVSMQTNHASRSEIVLPDGSVVKLNSGSNISYTYNKDRNMREVKFQGEGFFNVSKNNTAFVISLDNGVTVKVMGTKFNLKAYRDDRVVQTSLVEGCVEMTHKNKKIRMKPGEMVAFNKDTKDLAYVDGDLSHSYGWMNNKIYMENMSLGEVCKYLERIYNVNIFVQENLKTQISYNGVIKEETIVDVLNALAQLSDINYNIDGKNIYINSK